MKEISLEFEDRLEYLTLATCLSRQVCNTIKHSGVNEEFVNDVELAVSEACTNAIKHCGDTGKTNKVILSFQIYHDRLVVNVKEQGNGFDIHAITMPDSKQYAEGGYGICIIRSKMCIVDYYRQGDWNVLAMTKFFKE